MSRTQLEAYGLVKVGRIALPDALTFQVLLEHPEAALWERVIYAFLVGDEIMRVGSSKGRFSHRVSAWTRDVTKALRGQRSSTPLWEAEAWRDHLMKHNGGEVFARVATTVVTPVGEFPAYMDEESILINRHRPRLNRHKNR